MFHLTTSPIEGYQHLNRYLDAMPLAALLLDQDAKIIGANQLFYELVDASSDADVINRSIYEINGGSWNSSSLRELFTDPELSFSFVDRVQLEADLPLLGRRTFSFSHSLLTRSKDSYVRLITISDVTANQELELALKRSEARTQTLLTSAVDAIVIINTRGAIKAFNPAAERLFGYSAEEVLGMNVRLLMPTPYRDEHDSYLKRYLQTRERRVIGIGREVVGQRKDGATFPMELSISEVFDGEEQLFVGTVRDITTNKRTEEALRDSEARGRAILSTAVDAIVTIDETGLIKSLNQSAQNMFGYTYHEMIGENVKMLMPAPYKDEHDSYLENYRKSGIARVIGLGREAVGRRKDGSTFPMELSVSEVRQGDCRYFTGIVRDITDRKRFEERLRSIATEASESELRVTAQAEELSKQAERLRIAQLSADAASQAKSHFLANMSHEIRTPMTAILGYADELGILLAGRAEAQSIEIIRRNGEHLLEIINDILDISKIESGALEIELVPCSPIQVVAGVISLMRIRSKQKGIELRAHYNGQIPRHIESSPTRLHQILVNLVGNAIKFTETGKVEVRVELIDQKDETPMLRFQVIDTGIGITTEQLKVLFKPFSQADSSVSRRFGGTGLGLALSKHLVELLDGVISVESTYGIGSAFSVDLPIGSLDIELVSPEEASCTPHLLESKSASLHERLHGRILLAEDGEDNRMLIAKCLIAAGAQVEVAEDGQQALEKLVEAEQNDAPFDLLVTDMQMPRIDGYTLARRIREEGRRTPIVALTAHAMAEDRQKCLDAGCNEFVTKPIERAEFLTTCAKYVGAGCPTSNQCTTAGEHVSTKPTAPSSHPAPLISDLLDDDEMSPLLDTFLVNLEDKTLQMREKLRERKLDEVGRLAHQLAGSGKMYGFPPITEAARQLDQSIMANDSIDNIQLAFDKLSELCDLAISSHHSAMSSSIEY